MKPFFLRLTAAALCLALLSGCGLLLDPSAVDGPAGGSQPVFSSAPTAYADMVYRRCSAEEGEALLSNIRAYAKEGGTQEAFNRDDDALVDYLHTVATMRELIDLQCASDPTDQRAAEESLYSSQLYRDLNEGYWEAMHALSVTGHGKLLKEHYTAQQIQWFISYDAPSAEEALYAREDALCQRYRSLMAAEPVDEEAVAQVFLELVELRREIAAQAGCDSYADYAYASLYVRSYTPADSQILWHSAREYFAPDADSHAQDIYEQTESLFSTDRIDCGPDAILDGVERCLSGLSGELSESLSFLRSNGLYDIAPSAAKADTGYTTYLFAYDVPFLFNAPSSTYYDYTQFIHEFGHFTNYYLTGCDLLFGMDDNDLGELQSQGMEALLLPRYEELFGGVEGAAIRREALLNLFYSVVDGALFDEFLQRVYAEEALSQERVSELYAQVCQAYGYASAPNGWMYLEHNFLYPFYYISYAVSAISALELYTMLLSDPDEALNAYLTVEAMDCSKWYFTDALKEAGLSDVFDPEACRRIAAAVDLSA
nr:M3 family metallopeptidase [Dysosmobacter acutus]